MSFTVLIDQERKQCTKCGKLKTLDQFELDLSGKGKRMYRARCKPCKNKAQSVQRKAARLKAKQEALRAAALLQEAVAKEQRTPGRTFVYHWDQTYKPEPHYVRNNGNKHIPSRGAF